MKLLYLLLAWNVCAGASQPAGKVNETVRQRKPQSPGAIATGAQKSPKSGKNQSLREAQDTSSYDYNYRDNCIGAVGGVCFATAVCCCYLLYQTKP